MSERCGCKIQQRGWQGDPETFIAYCPTHLAAFEMLEAIKGLKALLPKEATATESYMFRCGMTDILKKLTP